MLVLTRRLNQSIKIGDNIEITVIEVRGGQVRIGVTAPRDVTVHRNEVYLQIKQGDHVAPVIHAAVGIGQVNNARLVCASNE